MDGILERYADDIDLCIQCPDRVVITGTLPTACYADGMTRILSARKIRIFDYFDFTKPLKDAVRDNAEQIARQAGLEIEFIRKIKVVRKEERIQEILAERGTHPGLVHVFSAMETCSSYKPWHDKVSHRTSLKPDGGKCLHYYFYFIDEDLGLCYLRVPTWCPFRLQFYFNGHNWLASQLENEGIAFQMLDNAFLRIDDPHRAQELADAFEVTALHRKLDHYTSKFCPVCGVFGEQYHWSLMQTEYATDIVFRDAQTLAPLYEEIVRTAIHSVKSEQVATFLGRKLHGNYQDEMGTHFHTRIEGTRIKHHMGGKAAIKMYDKFGRILRIETTVNDVTFFKHYREVEHRDGSRSMKQAPMRKTIYSLPALMELCRAANRRYLEFLSSLEHPGAGLKRMEKLSNPARSAGRSYRGFNLLATEDQALFAALACGEFNISGFTNRALRRVLPQRTSSQISRRLKRLRTA